MTSYVNSENEVLLLGEDGFGANNDDLHFVVEFELSSYSSIS